MVEHTVNKQLNVGCQGTSHISHRALEYSNNIPDVSRRDLESVSIFVEIGRIGVDWCTPEDPVVSQSGVITGYVCVTGDVEGSGLPSQ